MKVLQNLRLAVATATLLAAGTANAQQIVSAVGATINVGGPGFGSINDTFNKSGLLSTYISGVTNFDAYIATNPLHTPTFAGFEWFSNLPSTTANVTYDLGSVMGVDRVALWNEEASGIGRLNLLGSVDGLSWFNLATGLTPTDNPGDANYGADVFAFGAVNLRYVQFDMSQCPQPNRTDSFASCAIGEVAFRNAEVTSVPEPGTYLLVASGLAGLVFVRRRRSV